MNTFQHVDHSKADPRFARRTRSVKAKPVARLESSPETPLGSFRGGERVHSSIDSEDFRCGRRDPGTCSDEILPDSERRIKSLCSSVRRFRDATIKEECKSDYPHALHALWKALDRAEDLIQN
jgi:hypothetical protein